VDFSVTERKGWIVIFERDVRFDGFCKATGFRRYEAVGMLTMFWRFAEMHAESGDITDFSAGRICNWVGARSRSEWDAVWRALVDAGWVDVVGGRYVISDWPAACPDTVHLRLARLRGVFADGSLPRMTRLPSEEREAVLADYKRKYPERF
jgi:hypothetical protein